MSVPRRLIESLITDPSVEQFHQQQLSGCSVELQNQGLQAGFAITAQTTDTAVGFMRRLGREFHDPLTNAPMELLVYLLAKVDGTVQCWSELWGMSTDAAQPEAARRISLGGGSPEVTIPQRLRLARTALFETQLARGWKQLPSAAALVQQLKAQGVMQDDSLSPVFARQVSAALTA